MVAESVHFEGDRRWAEEFLRLARSQRQPLEYPLIETEVVRRRGAVLVTDAQNDPRTIRPFVRATRTKSFVAAPVMPEGRVIGILEADCYFTGRHLDRLDRDTLWTFAEGFACALERTVLLERLRSQQGSVHTLLASTMEAMTEVSHGDVELSPSKERTAGASASDTPPSEVNSAIKVALTARELEVLALMAAGSTNAEVASRLVISQSTVKSHVKHILRKLGAANRVEAASRYLLALRSGTVPPGMSLTVGPSPPGVRSRPPANGSGEVARSNGPGDAPHR
jgi:DNA-binding CsgD family transcriptional regulator